MTTLPDRYTTELSDWLRIPSISADPSFAPDVRRAAQWLVEHVTQIGAHSVTLHETAGHPIVTAKFGNDPKKPTVLVYGHYDVQPSTPDDLWTTPAFEPTIRDGKIYARGSADDKGQVFIHLKALEEMRNALSCNITLLIEGEEECGSDNLVPFIEKNADMLACDAVLISDTSIIATNTPSLTVGLRGMSYIEVTVTGACRDLHSGIYGGTVANPIHALSHIISQLHDQNGRVTIPGFYDNVKNYSANERAAINRAPFNETQYKAELKVNALVGETGFTPIERTGIRPCLDVNGMWGGYTGTGAKTVLPSQAHAKISMRLVPDQDHDVATKQLIDHLHTLTPPGVTLTAKPHHGGAPAVTKTDGAAYQAAFAAMRTAWGADPIPMFEGGSIPIVADLNRILAADVVLMGFGLNSDAIHSPNEHFRIDHITRGIAAVKAFYSAFAKV
jgi:acetylornithine deacetylase/succinyl-diaminopimelate desuccinylase-like protein